METLKYTFEGGRPVARRRATLVGVVGSGNLEILVEPRDDGAFVVEVTTAATGFGAIWRAVITDFHDRHGLAGITVSVNDVGATPAVVSLRLDQAIETYLGGSQ